MYMESMKQDKELHDLEQWIAEWRKNIPNAADLEPEALDELEGHLRDSVDQLVQSGMPLAEAFRQAVAQLGPVPAIVSEFQKLHEPAWLPVKVIVGLGASLALLLAVYVFARFDRFHSDFLLASHVFAVTLGYMTVFLSGALGTCFIFQRCFSDFSPMRLQFLTRVSFVFHCVAASLTALGVVLGMAWSHTQWGRFWGWDSKEIGALCVMVWLICLLCIRGWRRITPHAIQMLGVMGNIVVSLGWFGGNLLAQLHSYGTGNSWWFLLAAVVANLCIFGVGFARPALKACGNKLD